MQFKLAMERINNKEKNISPSQSLPQSQSPSQSPSESPSQSEPKELRDTENGDELKSEAYSPLTPFVFLPDWANQARIHSEYILNFLVPLGWIFLFVLMMDRDLIISTLYMPFLGIFAACLANTVPIGGGIVYVPALMLLGVDMKLGVSFTVATMSFGNGVFGFLRWMNKNSRLILWDSFWYTVIPSWIGSVIGIFLLPPPSPETVKLLFACVCLIVAVIVALAGWQGGVDKISFSLLLSLFSSESSPSSSTLSYSSSPHSIITTMTSFCSILLTIVSFFGGLFLVPNIGIGPALTTYLILSYCHYPTHSAIVTGIITGGWVCVIPFLIHIIYHQDIPYSLWLMVIPGVYLGATFAPYVHEYVGMKSILLSFAVLLVINAYILIM